ncbi:MAG: S8 family peptidase [Candidatus Binatia bacterium]
MKPHFLTAAGAGLIFFIAFGVRQGRVQERIPNDPYLYSKATWGQDYLDQWAHWKIGLTPIGSGKSAWDIETGEKNPIVVAFVDSGLDYVHPEIAKENIWVNKREIPANGIDDDKNGFIDDLIGWNFIEKNNNPWDNDGHGTFTAGIVAARTNSGEGIAGINRGIKIMPLRALNFMGRGSVSHMVAAITYAADNGARIVNLSIEQLEEAKSRALQYTIDYAYKKGVLVVVASGNQGRDTATISPSGLERVITVAATDVHDKRMGFSNWGKYVRIAAPGEEILSLRARRTDLLLIGGTKHYQAGRAFLGSDAKYYHATGTSFAAPFVTGVASLILAKNPRLTNKQVERMLLMSADDVDAPGWDQLTGYGRLNARKALEADPDYYLYVELHKIAPARDGGRTVLQISGTATGSHFGSYHLEVGQGENPKEWRRAGRVVGGDIKDGLLGTLAQSDFGAGAKWTVRVAATDKTGKQRESRQSLTIK